jgi:Tol biopolymer transport system component
MGNGLPTFPTRKANSGEVHSMASNGFSLQLHQCAQPCLGGRRTGNELYSWVNPDKPWNIFLVRADGEPPEQLTFGEAGPSYGDPTWSPDGNLLVFGGLSLAGVQAARKLIINVLNLTTHQVSVLPGSNGLYSPRWSPDGHHISALSINSDRLLLFDFQTQRWMELAKASIGNPNWSHDSEYIYFDTLGKDAAFFRVRVRNRKVERIIDLKDFRRSINVGTFGPWTGLAPDGSLLLLRDASFDEIYALDWDAP